MSIDVSKIYEDCKKEVLTNNSMFLLTKEVRTEDSGYAEWSFSADLEKLKKYFTYAFVLVKIVKDNEKYDKDTISTTLISNILDIDYNDKYVLTDLEKKFISYFDECLSAKTPKQFKVLSKKMCEFLSKNGYSVDVELYTSPKKAMPVAMELDMCLPKGTIGIGAVLFDFVIGVENYLKENN